MVRQRYIMHVDMDAFFASVEQLDHPEYRGKPVIVGGLSGRGVVSTCSYEARKFGVHSAMPMTTARRLCPQAIYVQGRYDRYTEISREIRGIFREFSPVVEPLSIDEAFLDLTGMEALAGDVYALGPRIKQVIREKTGLTASVGLAPNKFLAKLASDLRKPDGLVIIRPEEAAAFIGPLPVGRIFGLGQKSVGALEKWASGPLASWRAAIPGSCGLFWGKTRRKSGTGPGAWTAVRWCRTNSGNPWGRRTHSRWIWWGRKPVWEPCGTCASR